MRRRGRMHLVRRGILLLPANFSAGGIDCECGFLLALAGENVNASSGKDGRRVADADFGLPPQIELFGPGFRFAGENPVAILASVNEPETGSLAWAATRVKVARAGGPDGKLILFAGSLREQGDLGR